MIIRKTREYTYVPNKPFGALLDTSTNLIFLKTNSEYNEIEVWLTDQNSRPLEIEDRINLTMVIKWSMHYKNEIFNWTTTKTAEATGALIGNKIADKITSISNKKSPDNNEREENVEVTTHKEERQEIIDELRLVPKNCWC